MMKIEKRPTMLMILDGFGINHETYGNAIAQAYKPELDRIFSLWKQNALLLCMDADGSPDVKAMSRIEKLADTLNIKLIKNGAVPSELTEKQSELFYSAAQEALANAAKHAQAKTLEIAFEEDDDRIVCRFTNDGNVPKGGVRFSGGLANLSLLAKKQNASVSAGSGENFTLSLIFNKNQPNG